MSTTQKWLVASGAMFAAGMYFPELKQVVLWLASVTM